MEPVGQRGREHPLVDEHPGELAQVQLLLDRVDAEADREQDDADPQGVGRDDLRFLGEERQEGEPGADPDQQDRGEDP